MSIGVHSWFRNQLGEDQRQRHGFSLIELLTVMAVIALAAALVLPALYRARHQARRQQTRLEMAQIVAALTAYESLYGRFPVSNEAQAAAAASEEDMTYGGVLQETHAWLAGPGYLTNNAELMPALLDLEYYGDGTPTSNCGHAQNPQKTKFLEARQPGGTNSAPGVGMDGIYRDPWGSPYLITLDLNQDGRTRDMMYRNPEVSEDPANPARGLCGMIKTTNLQGKLVFEAPCRVLVWSAGPDRRVDTHQRANEGVNRDNILSCER